MIIALYFIVSSCLLNVACKVGVTCCTAGRCRQAIGRWTIINMALQGRHVHYQGPRRQNLCWVNVQYNCADHFFVVSGSELGRFNQIISQIHIGVDCIGKEI